MLNSESLIFHCWSINDSLMILWRNIDITPKISMQAKFIFKGIFDLVSETLMFHCCFVDDSLMTLWRDIIETLIISMETFKLYCFCCVSLWTLDVSLLLHWWLVDDCSRKHWRHYEELDANAKNHWIFYCDNHQKIDVPLLLDWLIVDDPMKNL